MEHRGHRSILLALVLSGMVAVSCTEDGRSRAERVREAAGKLARFACQCAEEYGDLEYGSIDECAADSLSNEDVDQACADSVWNDPEYETWVECYVDALDEYADCFTAFGCMPPEFTCEDGIDSVPQSWVCDGQPDCPDGSDEVGCTGGCVSPDAACGDPPQSFIEAMEMCKIRFSCADGNGDIPASWQCDGEPDCADGSDEQGC